MLPYRGCVILTIAVSTKASVQCHGSISPRQRTYIDPGEGPAGQGVSGVVGGDRDVDSLAAVVQRKLRPLRPRPVPAPAPPRAQRQAEDGGVRHGDRQQEGGQAQPQQGRAGAHHLVSHHLMAAAPCYTITIRA